MPFIQKISSINFNSKIIYAKKARFPFTINRKKINHLQQRNKASLVIYALNADSHVKPVKIYDVNNEKKQEQANNEFDQHLQVFEQTLVDKLDHLDNKDHADKLYNSIIDNLEAFSLYKGDIGRFKGPIKARLYLNDETPIFEQLRPQPYGYREILRQHEEEMIKLGIVEEGESEFRFNRSKKIL